MRNLTIILLAFIIGLNFGSITNYLKKEINQANKIQYCNDIYLGNSDRIMACIGK